MRRIELRIIFLGELGSTFSRLHYEVLEREARVVLWVAGQKKSDVKARSRESFRSVRDWWERLKIRSTLELETFTRLGVPLSLMRTPACPIYFTYHKDPSLWNIIEELNADLIVSAGFSRILPENILALPRLGAFNCHPSPLPRYAGSDPWFWILRRGETESAVTVHRMVAEADAGAIVNQKRFPVPRTVNHQQLYNYSSLESALLLKECVDLWVKEIYKEVPQDLTQRSFFPAPRREDYQIDWTRSARDIENLVRASSPAPGAWTVVEGRHFAVRKIEAIDGCTSNPGVITQLDRKGLSVCCGEGGVRIRTIELEGKEVREAEIHRALRVSSRDRLGE
jgi:methionyl-tRNA formyltransferase